MGSRESWVGNRVSDERATQENGSPNSRQRAVTRATTEGSISRASGHSRKCPSSGQVRVASMPILAPNAA